VRYQVVAVAVACTAFLAPLRAQDGNSNPGNRTLLGSSRTTQINVDENCRISEVAPHSDGQKEHIYKDNGICQVSGERVSTREETTLDDDRRKHINVTIREHTFALHNPTANAVTFVVQQKVPEGWQIDSDPQPNSVTGTIAAFLVDTDPGQTVNLHVGERKPPAVAGELAVATAEVIPFTPPPNARGHSAWIRLNFQAQESNLCVPTSASIVLDYFGDQVGPREIKELSMGRRYSPDQPFDDFTITLFRDLISGLHSLGYSWEEVDYPNNADGLWEGIAQVKYSLDAGIPVLVDTSTSVGHTFVVAGYSESEKSLYAVDPSLRAPGVRIVTFQELESIWNSSSVGFDKRAAVFPHRRHNKN
jgi:hypothetical protein